MCRVGIDEDREMQSFESVGMVIFSRVYKYLQKKFDIWLMVLKRYWKNVIMYRLYSGAVLLF